MKHVVVYREIEKKHLDYLRNHCQVSYYPKLTEENEHDFREDLKKAHGLFGSGMLITEELINEAINLRVVSNFSAGYDNLDLKLLTEKGIIATNAPDALTDTVADLIFASLLSTARRVVELDRFIRSKNWKENIGKNYFGIDVHHRTMGIIGMGRIGRALAKRAKRGFDMDIIYHKRTRDPWSEQKFGAKYTDLIELLGESDFICLTVPLTEETKHMISTLELNRMKPNSILMNASRGGVIDEQALIKALKDGKIRGAGLDVFENEPLDVNSELLSLENVVVTPHIGSATHETRSLMVEHGIKNLLSALNGKRPMNILNGDVFGQAEFKRSLNS